MTADLVQLHDFKFPSGLDWSLATLTCRVDDLAARLGLEVECWEEDGLGPARGFALGPSTSPTLISEQVFHVASDPLRATTVTIDGGEAATIGHAVLLDRVLAMLRLDRHMVSWIPDDPVGWALGAAQLLVQIDLRQARNS